MPGPPALPLAPLPARRCALHRLPVARPPSPLPPLPSSLSPQRRMALYHGVTALYLKVSEQQEVTFDRCVWDAILRLLRSPLPAPASWVQHAPASGRWHAFHGTGIYLHAHCPWRRAIALLKERGHVKGGQLLGIVQVRALLAGWTAWAPAGQADWSPHADGGRRGLCIQCSRKRQR